MKLPHSLRSLREQNFRRYYVGQTVSLLGSWMQSTAVMWLAYRLTGSTVATGTVGFLALAPYIFVTPVAGALADRVSRRKLLVTVLSLSVINATALAVLTYTEHITIGIIGVLAFVQGILNSIEVPTRHAFFIQLIADKEDLPNAIALNSININSTRLLGPALGGMVIAATSEAACFGLNAISFLAVLVQLRRISPKAVPRKESTTGLFADLIEGLKFAMKHPVIAPLLLTLGVVSFAVSPYTVLMPAIAIQTFGKGAALNGLFISGAGVGALIGAILLVRRPNVRGLTGWLLMTMSLAAIGTIGFSVSQNEWLSFLCMAMTGMGLMGSSTSVNTILQSIVEENMRGRIISIYAMFYAGAAPLGHLAAGWLAGHIGAPRTFTVCGLICAAAALGYGLYLRHLRSHLRPIYVKRGIIPATPGGTDQ